MGELRSDPDEPDDGDRPAPGPPDSHGDLGAIRERIEPRSRTEYGADLEQRAASGWAEHPFRLKAAVDVLGRFEPRRAGLPETSPSDAAAYLGTHHAERPWLAAARGSPPEILRIFAALDRGGGHAHIRHEGWVTEEMNERRVAYLEDPAQLDPVKRAAGIDGLTSPGRPHRCRQISSRITDPEAFAVAFARGVEHPAVRASLDMKFAAKQVPRPVSLDLSSLLGPDGHRYCTRWRLHEVDGSMDTARGHRARWVQARSGDCPPDVPEPRARPVGTFAGGSIVFAFGPTSARDRYEVVTMYPRPRRDGDQR